MKGQQMPAQSEQNDQPELQPITAERPPLPSPSGRVPDAARRRRTERGEGVISAAIAVLIMAFLGAAMWFAFSNTMNHAQSKVDSNVTSIGSDGGGGSPTGGGVGGSGPAGGVNGR